MKLHRWSGTIRPMGSLKPLITIGLLLLVGNLVAWSGSDCDRFTYGCAQVYSTLSSKMIINGIDRMVSFVEQTHGGINAVVAQAVSCLNECSIPSCCRHEYTTKQVTICNTWCNTNAPATAAAQYAVRTFAASPPASTSRRALVPVMALAVEPIVRRACVQSTAFFSVGYKLLPTGLDIYKIMAQIAVESSGNHAAVSSEGCIGLLQVHPLTAGDYGVPVYYLDHPVIGLDAGITIMSHHFSRFHFVTNSNDRWAMSLAAYNAGYSRVVRAYRTGGREWQRHIPAETRRYLKRVMQKYYGGVK